LAIRLTILFKTRQKAAHQINKEIFVIFAYCAQGSTITLGIGKYGMRSKMKTAELWTVPLPYLKCFFSLNCSNVWKYMYNIWAAKEQKYTQWCSHAYET